MGTFWLIISPSSFSPSTPDRPAAVGLIPWSTRTVGTSHESFPDVLDHHRCSLDVLTAPHHDVLVNLTTCRSSWLFVDFHHPQHQYNLQQSVIWHSADVTEQQTRFLFRMVSRIGGKNCKHFSIWDLKFPPSLPPMFMLQHWKNSY